MEELKISVDGAKIRIRVNDSPCFGIALTPDMAREAARILNIYAIIAEAEAEQFQRNHKQALQKDTK